MSTRILEDGSIVRKCSGCNQYYSRTVPRRFATSQYLSKFWCKQCLEKSPKYDVPYNLRYLINFEIIALLKFKKYLDSGKFKVMKIDRKIPDCSKLIASSDDVSEALASFNQAVERADWRNEEICIEWDLNEVVDVKKKFYKKFHVLEFNDIQDHPLFKPLDEHERNVIGLGFMLNFTEIKVYYIESHASYFTGVSVNVVRVGRAGIKSN